MTGRYSRGGGFRRRYRNMAAIAGRADTVAFAAPARIRFPIFRQVGALNLLRTGDVTPFGHARHRFKHWREGKQQGEKGHQGPHLSRPCSQILQHGLACITASAKCPSILQTGGMAVASPVIWTRLNSSISSAGAFWLTATVKSRLHQRHAAGVADKIVAHGVHHERDAEAAFRVSKGEGAAPA